MVRTRLERVPFSKQHARHSLSHDLALISPPQLKILRNSQPLVVAEGTDIEDVSEWHSRNLNWLQSRDPLSTYESPTRLRPHSGSAYTAQRWRAGAAEDPANSQRSTPTRKEEGILMTHSKTKCCRASTEEDFGESLVYSLANIGREDRKGHLLLNFRAEKERSKSKRMFVNLA